MITSVESDVKTQPAIEQVKNEDSKSSIKQPVIKLNRLTEEDQALLQKSLKEFIESKPERAKDLGIEIKEEEENEEDSGRSRKAKRKADNSDDEYQPDTFSALVSGNKKRKVAREKSPEPIVVAKPKLRRVEKKFVPVLEKLSTEELMETNTYHRFNKSIEVVLRTAEDIDVNEIGRLIYYFQCVDVIPVLIFSRRWYDSRRISPEQNHNARTLYRGRKAQNSWCYGNDTN